MQFGPPTVTLLLPTARSWSALFALEARTQGWHILDPYLRQQLTPENTHHPGASRAQGSPGVSVQEGKEALATPPTPHGLFSP